MNNQNTKKITSFGIIGLGLIGGSIAKALRHTFPVAHIEVADVDSNAVNAAVNDGVVSRAVDAQSLDFGECDILFVCTPPHIACEDIKRIDSSKFSIITDVASVKSPIMKAACNLTNFIGGHPMAGSEGAGYGSAEQDLFVNASWILTIPENCGLSVEQRETLVDVIKKLGANPIYMDAELHDKRVALISHLPHVAAFALSELAASANDDAIKQLIGGGFRDTTRIAASSPSLWTDIFTESEALIPTLEKYVAILNEFLDLLNKEDKKTINSHLTAASDFRRAIPDGLRAKNNLDTIGEKQ